jgi:Protein of unknown function (DUF3089)
MKRSGLALLLTLGLAASGCGSSAPTTSIAPNGTAASTPASSAPLGSVDPSPAGSASTSPAPDTTTWLCRPGLADNPCAGSLDATAIDAGGKTTLLPAAPAADPPIDCFYVYPTVSRQSGVNADLTIDPAERNVALAQAAQFSRDCLVYAPMYRQLTLAGISNPSRITFASALIAYGDVVAAFHEYMSRYNRGRGIVFIGHSQGSMMLTVLLRAEVDPKPDVRKLLVSAILAGGNVTVPSGKLVGGDFSNIPACSSNTEIGCVVAYSSFDATPPADAVFGRIGTALRPFSSGTAGLQIMCVNPAAPGGGRAALEPYFPTADMPAYLGSAAAGATTPFVTYPNQYAAQCVNSGGASWLQIDKLAGTLDIRAGVRTVEQPTWGLHLVDISIAEGNLVDLVHSEAGAFR